MSTLLTLLNYNVIVGYYNSRGQEYSMNPTTLTTLEWIAKGVGYYNSYYVDIGGISYTTITERINRAKEVIYRWENLLDE